jgi:putative serine protease PepD
MPSIAVIHVSLTGLTQARLGDSSAVKVGETVVAFGAPLGLQGTVTSGIVSALHRPVSTEDTTDGSSSTTATQATIDAIQTDAAINPGNSGGPLVDLSGDVIGINSAIASVAGASGDGQTTESGNIGVGFAIPINEALYTADQLIATGHAVHAIIGVSLAADTDATQSSGATVAAVTAGGPAAKAGIEKGDVITAIDGMAIPDADSAIVAVRADHKPGDVVSITFTRGGKTMTVQVTLGASTPS